MGTGTFCMTSVWIWCENWRFGMLTNGNDRNSLLKLIKYIKETQKKTLWTKSASYRIHTDSECLCMNSVWNSVPIWTQIAPKCIFTPVECSLWIVRRQESFCGGFGTRSRQLRLMCISVWILYGVYLFIARAEKEKLHPRGCCSILAKFIYRTG